jgi:hypothetical protein
MPVVLCPMVMLVAVSVVFMAAIASMLMITPGTMLVLVTVFTVRPRLLPDTHTSDDNQNKNSDPSD